MGCCWQAIRPRMQARVNTELFADAYVAQFAHFVDCVATGSEPSVSGADARVALEIALAARESVETGQPVVLNAVMIMRLRAGRSARRWSSRELPIIDRVRRIHDMGFAVEIWSWHDKDLEALAATGARFTSMTGYLHGDLIDPAIVRRGGPHRGAVHQSR